MKITSNSAVAFAFVACAMFATSCAKDVETDINIDPVGNAIRFAPSVGHTSRATEINIGNLGDFAVAARGMHPNGVLYDSYLIGSHDEGGEIARFQSLASDNKASGIWALDRSVYWPISMKQVLFIGYTTLKRDDNDKSESSSTGVLGEAKFSIPTESDKPTISDFKPIKNDLTETEDKNDGIWADGKNQKDLLVAFKQQSQSIQTTVNLNFRHALTQVSITAKQKDKLANDHRIVKVKGAWIVNATESGTLSASISINKTTEEASNKTTWEYSGRKTYGSYYENIIPLDKDEDKDLLHHSLMLIPEELTAWNGSSENTTGAYIMLLCRVELKHKGTTHDANTNIEDVGIDNDNHYHQLFPVNTEKYNGAEYGFVCVPISTDWGTQGDNDEDCKGAGRHYTYNLDICGATSGAGVYPPIPTGYDNWNAFINDLIPNNAKTSALVLKDDKKGYELKTVDLKIVTTRPTDSENNELKHVGDKVLDEPIKFNVTVDPWKDPENWTSGNVKL